MRKDPDRCDRECTSPQAVICETPRQVRGIRPRKVEDRRLPSDGRSSSGSPAKTALSLQTRVESFLPATRPRSEENTSELQSLMRISSAVLCLTKKISNNQ